MTKIGHSSFSALQPKERLILALDVDTVDEARRLIELVDDYVGIYKIGYQLAYATGGLAFAKELEYEGRRVFLDLKLLDIDSTVAHGVQSIHKLGVSYLTIHAYPKAMRAAVAARGSGKPFLLGVTALTSMDNADLEAAGYSISANELVVRRAIAAASSGMDGIVCSAVEAPRLREHLGNQLILVTPGIRPIDQMSDDQRRIATPFEAVRNGADLLVIGRPITQAVHPGEVAARIVDEIAEAS